MRHLDGLDVTDAIGALAAAEQPPAPATPLALPRQAGLWTGLAS